MGPEIGHTSTTGRGRGCVWGSGAVTRYNLHFTEGFLRSSRYKAVTSPLQAVTKLQNKRPSARLLLPRCHAPDHRLLKSPRCRQAASDHWPRPSTIPARSALRIGASTMPRWKTPKPFLKPASLIVPVRSEHGYLETKYDAGPAKTQNSL